MKATQNKTTENNTIVKDFLNTIADEAKRKDCFRIAEIFEKESGYEAKMWGTAIVGFGSDIINMIADAKAICPLQPYLRERAR